MEGVDEEGVAFARAHEVTGLGRFRHFGSEGPLYEVLEHHGPRVLIKVVESGETTEYPLASALTDPRA